MDNYPSHDAIARSYPDDDIRGIAMFRTEELFMFVYFIYVVIFIVSLILMYWFFKWLNKH
ncbi:MAG: hypothetical protein ACYC43_08640 [Burkholderiales bacterium]